MASKWEFFYQMDILDLQVCMGFLNENEWEFCTKRSDKIVIKPMDYTK